MAPTRRNPQSDEKVTPKDAKPNKSSSAKGSPTAQEVASPVLFNFFAFTLAMVVLPLGSYFASLNTIFNGNTTYSAALAAVMANLVLVAFVLQALREDQKEAEPEGKKER